MFSPSEAVFPPSATTRRARSPSLGFRLRAAFLCLLLLVLLFASVSGLYFETNNWRLDLLAHLRWPLCALTAALALFCLLTRHYLLLLLGLCLLAFNGSLLVHNWRIPPQVAHAAANAATARALSINVHSQNQQIDRVLAYIDSQSPDILALIEVTDKWLPALEKLRAEYPYQRREIWGNQFGSILLSRYPLSTPQRTYGYSGVGSIPAIVDLPQGRCLLLLVHPASPVTEHNRKWNAGTLRDIANYTTLANKDLPVLLLGDLNNSPWSNAYRQLLRDASLRPPDSKRVWWPTWRVISWPAAVPIDHFLLSPSLQDTHTWVGPNVGSDHYPIGLDFTLQPGS